MLRVKVDNIDVALWVARLNVGFDIFIKKLLSINNKKCICQAVRLDVVATWRHAVSAAIRAHKSLKTGRNIALKPEIEYVLRLLGRRQISEALKLASPENQEPIIIICFGDEVKSCIKKVSELNDVNILDDKPLLTLDEERAQRLINLYGLTENTPLEELVGRVLSAIIQLDLSQ